MMGDTVEEAEARLSELEHVKNFIEMLIKARKEEIEEAKQQGGGKQK